MAKDSPYFKFYVSEYNDGDIQLCSMEAQGLFTNLCSMYWSKEGELFLSKAKRLFKVREKSWKELIEEHVIKIENDKIIISFLDEQLKEREETSKQNSKNVAKRYEKQSKPSTPIAFRSTDNNTLVYNKEEKIEYIKEEDIIIIEKEEENFIIVDSEKIINPLQILEFYEAQLNGTQKENGGVAWRGVVDTWFNQNIGQYFTNAEHVKNSFKKFYLNIKPHKQFIKQKAFEL